MRIECPNCKASGTINDLEIPDDGMMLACPRCKESFRVEKPRKKATSAFATNTCPSCGYSTFCEEVFDECPHCGLDVKTVIERKRKEDVQKQELEMRNRNIRPDTVVALPQPSGIITPAAPAAGEKPAISLAGFANGFDPVAAVGWGVAVWAAVFLLLGGWGVIDYLGTDLQAQLSEQSIEPVSAWQVFWGYGFLPWIKLLYGLAALSAAFGFLQRAAWGMQGVQQVVMASLVLVPVYETGQYVVWVVKSIAPPWWAYLVEGVSAMLVSALWMAPLYFLLLYLKTDSLKRVYRKG
ncbi:zinc-ribbon domain-containing protein [Trichlorobacter lovleyi]|uniref:zinc-ribbon domain-containing protein n=1 Tax=Trichlorobacter lovleyi TaxID=313985 RepID=UPI0024817CB3|nr:zinc-ribbon domain-containing protein [Trichlorobacter lovleyi]